MACGEMNDTTHDDIFCLPLFARLSLFAADVPRRFARPWCGSINAAARLDEAADCTLVVEPEMENPSFNAIFIKGTFGLSLIVNSYEAGNDE